jgi:hypothetical protein
MFVGRNLLRDHRRRRFSALRRQPGKIRSSAKPYPNHFDRCADQRNGGRALGPRSLQDRAPENPGLARILP